MIIPLNHKHMKLIPIAGRLKKIQYIVMINSFYKIITSFYFLHFIVFQC